MSAEPVRLRWRHPNAGLYETEFGGHKLSVVTDEGSLWIALVDGKPAPAPQDARRRFGRADMAKDAAIRSLMPIHKFEGPGYCSFSKGMPPNWKCSHDRYWIGHDPANWEKP